MMTSARVRAPKMLLLPSAAPRLIFMRTLDGLVQLPAPNLNATPGLFPVYTDQIFGSNI